jgi:hypothetical protein
MNRRRRLVVAAAVAAVVLASLAPVAFAQAQTQRQIPPAAARPTAVPATGGGTLDVTVTYAGKGEVSKKNEVSIFLFTDPNITEKSKPIAVGTVEVNGGSFAFTGLPAVVYIAVVYDETGNYERAGPPPPGTPVSLYGMAAGGAAAGVNPGKGAKVTVTFDESNRMSMD